MALVAEEAGKPSSHSTIAPHDEDPIKRPITRGHRQLLLAGAGLLYQLRHDALDQIRGQMELSGPLCGSTDDVFFDSPIPNGHARTPLLSPDLYGQVQPPREESDELFINFSNLSP
jgi:hypothetical protein